MSLREHILKHAAEIPVETIEIPEWDCIVFLHGMTVKAQMEFMDRVGRTVQGEFKLDRQAWQAELLIATVHDESGERVFDPADREWLQGQPARLVSRIAQRASNLSGFGEEREVVQDFDETHSEDMSTG